MKSDVFAAVAVIDAKTPFYLEGGKQRNPERPLKK